MLTIRKSLGVLGLAAAITTAACSTAPKTDAAAPTTSNAPASAPVPATADASQGNVKTYPMRGVVVSLDPDNKKATLNHDKIDGFMEAMTMAYSVPDPADFAKLKVGEKITATMNDTPEKYWVSNVQPDTSASKK